MKTATTAAMCAAFLLGTALAGCSADGDSEAEQHSGSGSDTMRAATGLSTDSGLTLPAGVLPPDSPASPGDAPLGDDGHYNYDAPEFVLTNPCDDPKIMARLEKIGYREQQYIETRIQGHKQLGCAIESGDKRMIGIWYMSVAHSQIHKYNGKPIEDHKGTYSWVTFRQTNPLGNTSCITSVETSKGALGFLVDITETDLQKPDSELCTVTNRIMTDYLGEL